MHMKYRTDAAMTPLSELDRLFRDIPKPDPLSVSRRTLADHFGYPKLDPLGEEVDADETNHGPCAQGDCDE